MLLTRVNFANFLLLTEVYGFHSACFLDWIFQFFGSTGMWFSYIGYMVVFFFFAFFHILRTIKFINMSVDLQLSSDFLNGFI